MKNFTPLFTHIDRLPDGLTIDDLADAPEKLDLMSELYDDYDWRNLPAEMVDAFIAKYSKKQKVSEPVFQPWTNPGMVSQALFAESVNENTPEETINPDKADIEPPVITDEAIKALTELFGLDYNKAKATVDDADKRAKKYLKKVKNKIEE